jgi:ribosomal protein L14E/L6E/L27E
MMVCRVLKTNYVYVADGDNRTIDNPKKKNIRHLQKTNIISKEFAKRLKSKFKPSNVEIKNEIIKLASVPMKKLEEHKGGSFINEQG